MYASIARYLKRHRTRLAEAIASPLERPLGTETALEEARGFVSELESAFQSSDSTAFLHQVRGAVERWSSLGASRGAVGEALVALVRAQGRHVPRGGSQGWGAELGPILEFIPAPMVFVDAELRITCANGAFRELACERGDVLVGMRMPELLAGDPASHERSAPGQAQDALELDRVRLRVRPDQDLMVSRVPFAPNGRLSGWFVSFSADASRAIADATLADMLEREKRQKEKFAALLEVSHAVVNSLDLNTILGTIAKLVRQVIQTDECSVFLFDEAEQVLVPVVCDARSYMEEMMAVRLKLGEGITGMVAQTGRGEIVNDAEADPRAVTVPGTPPEQTALLCVPLLSRDKVVGVITLTRIGPRGFQTEDLELATLFAGQCSAAIANARLYENMKVAFDELRQTQAQLVQSAKLNALGEMAGGVAHDFNNILAAILGRTQLLLQTNTDSDLRRQLGVIEQAALDGAHTVRRVQEFTRVRQDERFETLDINQVLLGVLELTRPAWETGAKRRGVQVDVHLELQANLPTAGNASELREVFTNLVLNALDAMPDGGGLWITSENGHDAVRVQVRDSGVGMDEETRAKIFDPFFTTKEIKGTGLGLSVAYGIVSRHRGAIEVQSEPGVGTVFTLEFPVGAIESESQAADSTLTPESRRVLVVDDEQTVLEVLVDLLAAMGMQVTRAHGGPAGVEALGRDTFDVVFTDLGMPDVNGWDLALTAKACANPPDVVLVTGWGFQLEEEAAASRGVDLVMAKPFSWEDVENALRVLSARKLRAA
ncbi:MAG: GAF domain-containing protein [Candidatus Eisenbacteria bacterium]|uniref:histidine kinase n=1 Tax=Eiseniibacteriota bacterium TaxID=2212470 RepID=A0A933SBF8_UNCEI|nr:GAF domain-containing protein [Candidatus Eisenbacteria bacterium]